MSRFNGQHYKGYTKDVRAEKRAEAEARDLVTPEGRRRKDRVVVECRLPTSTPSPSAACSATFPASGVPAGRTALT